MKHQTIAAAIFLILSVLIIGTVSLVTPLIDNLEFKNYDFMMFLRGPDPAPEDVVIVAIDRFSLDVFAEELEMSWPWDRAVYAELIHRLNEAGVRGIAFDVIFDFPSHPESDLAFAQAIKSSQAPVVLAATIENVVTPAYSFEQEVLPLEGLTEAGASQAYTVVNPDRDAVVRHARLTVGGEPTLALMLYTLLNGQLELDEIPVVAWEEDDPEILINYVGQAQAIETVSFYQALTYEESLPEGIFQNQVVFVGRSESVHDLVAQSGGADMFTSPFDFLSGSQQIPGAEIHANIFHTLNQRRFIGKAPRSSVLLLVFALGVAASALMLVFSTIRDKILGSLLLLVGFLAATWVAFISFDYWILGFQPFLVGLLAVAMNTVYQYRTTEKERQQIEQMLSGYVSKDVIDTIMRDPTKLELGGVEVEATVLFSDIAGFSKISEKITPQELSARLNEYFTRMGDVIMQRDGMINKYIGDAIMAIWGAPLQNERHSILACEAALEMSRQVEEMGGGFRTRFGLNTGTMVAGNLGHHERMEYTVIGDAVNLASRLEGANKVFGTSIMISQFTEALIREHFLTRQLDLIRVVGRAQPVRVYEVVAGENGETPDQVREMVESFNEILEAYTRHDWEKAGRLLDKHLKTFPEDSVALVYRDRCRSFSDSPPEADWDGVYELTAK